MRGELFILYSESWYVRRVVSDRCRRPNLLHRSAGYAFIYNLAVYACLRLFVWARQLFYILRGGRLRNLAIQVFSFSIRRYGEDYITPYHLPNRALVYGRTITSSPPTKTATEPNSVARKT